MERAQKKKARGDSLQQAAWEACSTAESLGPTANDLDDIDPNCKPTNGPNRVNTLTSAIELMFVGSAAHSVDTAGVCGRAENFSRIPNKHV